MELNREIAAKVLEVVDVGLSSGLGRPTPGQMCVEAAVCYALGLPHGDQPECVAPILRNLKIAADADAYAYAAAADRELAFFAEEVVQILVVMKAPGTAWLDLTEAA